MLISRHPNYTIEKTIYFNILTEKENKNEIMF